MTFDEDIESVEKEELDEVQLPIWLKFPNSELTIKPHINVTE